MRRQAYLRSTEQNVAAHSQHLGTSHEKLKRHEALRKFLGMSLLTLAHAPNARLVNLPTEIPQHGFYRGTWDISIPEWGQLLIVTKHKESADSPYRSVVYDGFVDITGDIEADNLSPAERRLITVLDNNVFEHGIPDATYPEYKVATDLHRLRNDISIMQDMCAAAGTELVSPAEIM